MTFLKSTLLKSVLTAAIAGGSLAMTASVASADVVCNGAGECWHVRDRLTYPNEAGVVFHDDSWAAAHRDAHWHWRHDRFDHGYYRNGLWITF